MQLYPSVGCVISVAYVLCVSQAEEFHSTVHILLEWLAEAEQSLRFHGSLPVDEYALRSLLAQHTLGLLSRLVRLSLRAVVLLFSAFFLLFVLL